VFGGKITTGRALAEEALDKLRIDGRKATDSAPLPGGDVDPAFLHFLDTLSEWMPGALLLRLSRAYGTRLRALLSGAGALKDLGRHFGAGLYEAEVRHLVAHEFARTADDIIWRRTKLGLHMSTSQQQALATWLERHGPS
jgi:glycerol-3-phosphate dehydrogenase